jgi:hypothetical protein
MIGNKKGLTRAEDISAQNVPLIAGPDDTVVGFDELGGTVYRSKTGEEYTLYPETKTPQERPIVTAAKAVGEYLSDPSLPSLEETSEFAKETIKGAYEPFRKIASGDNPTYGDLSEVLPVGLSGAATRIGKPLDDTVLSSGGAGPTKKGAIPFFQKKESRTSSSSPDAIFGTKRVRDLFEEDQLEKFVPVEDVPGLGDESDWMVGQDLFIEDGYDFNTLGYARNIAMDSLARYKLGQIDLQELADQVGSDADTPFVDYVNSKLTRLSNNPEFVDYTQRLESNLDFDPFATRDNSPDSNKTVFRSPIPEALTSMEWPSKGKEGYQILSELKGNPNVRKSELDTVIPELDPKKRYSLGEVQELVSGNLWNTEVRIFSTKVTPDAQLGLERDTSPQYTSYQRQVDLQDPEKEYFELLIDSTREGDKPTFEAKGQHFNPSTLAHARASVREDSRGEYILPEEFQADLLQKGYSEPRASRIKVSPAEAVEKKKDVLKTYGGYDENDMELLKIIGEDHYWSYYNRQAYEDFVEKVGPEKLFPGKTTDEILGILDSSAKIFRSDDLVGLYANYKAGFKNDSAEINAMLGLGDEAPRGTVPNSNEAWDYFDGIRDTYYNTISGEISDIEEPGTSLPPIKKIEESVKMTLGALIAEADKRDIDRIVIPPFERIIARRFTPGTEGYKKALDPKSGFYKTYVKSTQAAIKDLEEEFGRENISSRPIDLNYTPLGYVTNTATRETADLPVTGIEINFKGLRESDYDLKRLRFAEGGMVEDDQMNRLMQEGGMADDGMSREPVTGNEIPPGSLASEVRDDIPAQLSEGEYVVPADVLRYYGVRFFEDLRAQAKQGMMEMESDGRIGGTPVNAQGVPMEGQEEQLTPEEEQMLMEALGGSGMAYGGMVGQPMTTPYQDQATMYQTPAGMQEGGMAFDRTQFTLDEPAAIPGSPSGIESRRYINPTTKEERTIQFMGNMPLGIVPEGFVPWSQELAGQPATPTPTTQTPTASTQTQRDGRDRDEAPTTGQGSAGFQGWGDKNRDAISSDPYSFGVDALSDKTAANIGRGAAIAGAVVGGPIGAVAGVLGLGTKATSELQNIAEARAALSVMEAKGLKGTTQYTDLEARVEDKIGSLPVAQRAAVRMGIVATGNQYAAAALSSPTTAAPTKTPTAAPTVGTSTKSTQKDSDNKPFTATTSNKLGFSPSTPSSNVGVTRTGSDKGVGFGASVGKVDTKSTSDKGLSMGTSAGNKATTGKVDPGLSKAAADARAKETQTSKDKATAGKASGGAKYGKAEGGLMAKSEKTSRNKKGLAS